ncbi:hypothetical protein BD289DRAFT_433911 [Coniella lustricola]|uniref:Uncharacterized protein n=1 Tax=Coniella lustricola TaxID=2025994 RepID=A0A2T3A819_9PEZI|nr:hypothetical protein BD289DRAFT_433911 [Coniella lustricola]
MIRTTNKGKNRIKEENMQLPNDFPVDSIIESMTREKVEYVVMLWRLEYQNTICRLPIRRGGAVIKREGVQGEGAKRHGNRDGEEKGSAGGQKQEEGKTKQHEE